MNYLIRKYYSGYCTYEIEAENENDAFEKTLVLPLDYEEILQTLEEWRECHEIEADERIARSPK